jgi:hypothetical protein
MRNADSATCWLAVLVLLSATLLLHGCHDSEQHLKSSVLGRWEEVHSTKETLQFDNDGTLIMKSPREYHLCVYDFPDSRHIRLNCAPVGALPFPQVWKISVTSDQLMISDDQETGTYQRRQDSAASQP